MIFEKILFTNQTNRYILSAAIDKYTYVLGKQNFSPFINIYSANVECSDNNGIVAQCVNVGVMPGGDPPGTVKKFDTKWTVF